MTSGALELVTFDCYGTLIDWRNGIADAFDDAVPGARAIDRDRLFRAYGSAEAEVQTEAYRTYRDVLAEAAARAARALHLGVPASRRYFLAESLPTWQPFPDTNPALRRLASSGFRLGILSNIDDDLLAETLEHLAVPFDVVITAEQLGSYKPRPAHFQSALERVDGQPDRLLHAAESYYHDVRAAESLGIRTVWVNRTGQPLPPGPSPFAEASGLAEAAEHICRV